MQAHRGIRGMDTYHTCGKHWQFIEVPAYSHSIVAHGFGLKS